MAKSNRGFASMSPEKRREIAQKGGKAVPNEKRSFSQNNALARSAGSKGGKSVPADKRTFAKDKQLAATLGAKGGSVSRSQAAS